MYSKGISWFDDCRIPFVDEVNFDKKLPIQQGGTIYGGGKGFYRTNELSEYNTRGRFPANLLVSDDMLNDGVISKSSVYDNNKGDTNGFHATSRDVIGKRKDIGGFNDKGSNSRYYDIDKWFDKIINYE